ncbi:MAG: hypothetical protein HWE39_10225 [Oceanospirillaceae bacterium]|nr:hypothetical protein [Oceanospirillaceae bacterium]
MSQYFSDYEVFDELVSLMETQVPNLNSKPVLWLAYGAYHERKLRWLQRHNLAKGEATQTGDINEWFASVNKSQLRDDVDGAAIYLQQLVRRKLNTSD